VAAAKKICDPPADDATTRTARPQLFDAAAALGNPPPDNYDRTAVGFEPAFPERQ